MHTRTQQNSASSLSQRTRVHPIYLNEGMTPKKTALIIITVIGCIAILWPKVFYPMMFGGSAVKSNFKEPQRGPGGIRQERPAHLHPDSIYQAMRERGRAIPATPTVPIVERNKLPNSSPPRMVEGRPGPVPGMRPPMGAGALHQPQTKGGSVGFIMPLYTIGIIVFFGYTVMKIMFKKPLPNAPYGPAPTDPNFRKHVFGHESESHIDDLSDSKLGWREHYTRTTKLHDTNNKRNDQELYKASLSATTVASSLSSTIKQHQQQYHQQQHENLKNNLQRVQQPAMVLETDIKCIFNKETEQLMEIEKLRKKLEDTERAMAKLIAEMNSDQYEAKKSNENTALNLVDNISNGHTNIIDSELINKNDTETTKENNIEIKSLQKQQQQQQQRRSKEASIEREMTVLGMEVTASCEGGQKWTGRPPTPVLLTHSEHSQMEQNTPEAQSIYLEGSLAHESKILVADSETKCEEVYDAELNGSLEEPAVVLSSKMTLSLINLDANEQTDNEGNNEIESPLADDIEIIGHDE